MGNATTWISTSTSLCSVSAWHSQTDSCVQGCRCRCAQQIGRRLAYACEGYRTVHKHVNNNKLTGSTTALAKLGLASRIGTCRCGRRHCIPGIQGHQLSLHNGRWQEFPSMLRLPLPWPARAGLNKQVGQHFLELVVLLIVRDMTTRPIHADPCLLLCSMASSLWLVWTQEAMRATPTLLSHQVLLTGARCSSLPLLLYLCWHRAAQCWPTVPTLAFLGRLYIQSGGRHATWRMWWPCLFTRLAPLVVPLANQQSLLMQGAGSLQPPNFAKAL